MSFFFADSFDLYALPADAALGHWDSITASFQLGVGRFAGSQSMSANTTGQSLVKSSGLNEGVHHFVVAIMQTAAISGSSIGHYIALFDGATAQCSVVFRSDGAILLAIGGANGTTIATYAGAVTASNTWFAFEIEVVVHNTAGSITVRKNGNPSNDFFLGSLNTRSSANNYANKITIGALTAVASWFDDFIWRSDPTSVAWIGDVRSYVRRPASDASVQWTPSGAVAPIVPYFSALNTGLGVPAGQARYQAFTASYTGTVVTVSLYAWAAITANLKAAIYAASNNTSTAVPTTALATSNVVANPALGAFTFTFPSPPSVTQGTQYFLAFDQDTTSGSIGYNNLASSYLSWSNVTAYASFPVSNPGTLSAGAALWYQVNITPGAGANAPMVCEPIQDSATTYVFSSTVSQSDLYGLSSLSATPATIVATVTRAFVQKSDAGTRNVAVQLKSGSTTVQGASTALNTTFGWLTRVDAVDPATGAAWTAVGVNNATIGAQVTA